MIKGYKVFNPDWTCRGFQYEVGKVYELDADPKCCERGFHFCENAADCFSYYNFDSKNKVAEVVALGAVATDGKKSCTNKIQVVREIPWQELLTIVNTGENCTGLNNTGDCNTGDRNTGDCNTGRWNTGDRNTGDCNTGHWNTGNWNTGDRNTGDWNKSSFNTGCFNTEKQKIMLFNKPSDMTYNDWLRSDARYLLNQIPKDVAEWVSEEDMTDEEKAATPTYKTTGGYLKVLDESENAQLWWDVLSDEQKECIKGIPNFDAEIFKQCTGIDVNKEQKEKK